jgi:hypothetical protein
MGVIDQYHTLVTLPSGKEPPTTLTGRLGVPMIRSANFGEEKHTVIIIKVLFIHHLMH